MAFWTPVGVGIYGGWRGDIFPNILKRGGVSGELEAGLEIEKLASNFS